MLRQTRQLVLTIGLVALPGIASATAGTCAHDEMRKWIKAERLCYDAHGPLNESWNIHDQRNQDALTSCVETAKADYVDARVRCELRGESAYREDGIHKDWERHRQDWDSTVSRMRRGG